MTAAAKHPLLVWGGLGAAGLAAYKWLYEPWKAAKDLAAAAAAGAGASPPGYSYTPAGGGGGGGGYVPPSFAPPLNVSPPSPGSMVTTPLNVGPAPNYSSVPIATNPGGPTQGSIVDPRQSPGGALGQAMWRKNWTQQQAASRLDAIEQGYRNALGAIQALQNQTNPAAAGIPAAQIALANTIKASETNLANYQASLAAGNSSDAAIWLAAYNGNLADIRDLNARIAAASAPPDNSAAIAAWEGTIQGLRSDYYALTGMSLG